uniref:Uncharacterized protein n=1 Tax=Kuenenia stuttgartiensis TaxID=174633 RepID=Q1PUI7_KUEST|nr:unknown protein [Candidatus Kuenenia stuttgartiensis]
MHLLVNNLQNKLTHINDTKQLIIVKKIVQRIIFQCHNSCPVRKNVSIKEQRFSLFPHFKQYFI